MSMPSIYLAHRMKWDIVERGKEGSEEETYELLSERSNRDLLGRADRHSGESMEVVTGCESLLLGLKRVA